MTNHLKIDRLRESRGPAAKVVKYREYARGIQAAVLTDKQRQILDKLLTNDYCDNVCHQIIAEASDRIMISHMTSPNDKVNSYIQALSLLLRIPDRQSDVHYNTLRDGNYVIALSWDNASGHVKMSREEWWNGSQGVWIAYDDDDVAIYGVKEWKNDDDPDNIIYRRNVWYPDRVERYSSKGQGTGVTWTPYETDTLKPEEPWKDRDGNPLGIPYIHFSNANLTYENYGDSELSGGVLGFQDQLTDMQYSITACSRLTAYQSYWASGVKAEIDPATGKAAEVLMHPGSWFTSDNSDAKFGVLPAGTLEPLLAAYHMKLKRVAQMTRTPIHAITGGDWPSGDALLRAELPAVNKARRQINKFKYCWIEVLWNCVLLHNAYTINGEQLPTDPETAPIQVKFEDPEKRDLISRATAVQQLGDRISILEGLRIMGYSDREAERIHGEMMADTEAKTTMLSNAIGNGSV